VVGIVVAGWGLEALRAMTPAAAAGTTDPATATLSKAVLSFNFAIALVAGAAVGLLPALNMRWSGVVSALKSGARWHSHSARGRGALVAIEVALALVLTSGAGLMVRSLVHLRDTDVGFLPHGLLAAGVSPDRSYESATVVQFLDEATDRLVSRPGVDGAAVANCLPAVGGCDNVRMVIDGRPVQEGEAGMAVQMNMVSGTYFQTMGIPLTSGRTFGRADRVDAPRVAIVSASAARQYWNGADPVGQRIRLSVGWDSWAEVIGVVGDVIGTSVDAPAPAMVYLPYAQQLYDTHYLVVRASSGDPLQLAASLREAVHDLDAGLPLWDLQTMDERIAAVIQPTTFTASLLSLAAVLALALAATGVFAVVAFGVAGRTREFGVRMALGSRASAVVGLVLRQALGYGGAGLALGLCGAVALTRVLESQLHGVTPTDPFTYGVTTVLLGVVVGLAAYVPARRATRVDPMEALRSE